MKIGLFTALIVFTGTAFSQCENFTLTLNGFDPVCHNDSNGSITTNTYGGNGPSNFTITDSTGSVVNSSPGGNPNLLTSGWYYVEVTDDSSCYLMDSIYLVNPPPLLIQISFSGPTSLNACDGIATVDTVINSQGNYTNIFYNWIPGGPSGIGENVKNDLCNDLYELTVYDDFGCSYHEELALGSAGIQETLERFKIYPNPTYGKLNIEAFQFEIMKVELFDFYGNQILEFNLGEQIDLSSLEQGQYLLVVTSGSGRGVSRIIKK